MKRSTCGWFSAVVLVLLPFGCSNKDAHPQSLPDNDTGVGETAIFDPGETGPAPDSGSKDAAHPETDSTPPSDSTVDTAEAAVPPLCAKAYSDIAPTPVGYPHSATGEQLAAVTWDELTMVWTTSDASGLVVVHYADRAARDDAFGAELTLPAKLGPFAHDKVALTADGLTMIFPTADHLALHQITRTARGSAFDDTSVTTTPFKKLMAPGTEGGSNPQVADLVLSRDGKWLFFTDLLRTAGTSTMLSVKLSDGTWDTASPVDATRLNIEGGKRRRPTGISADALTVFFYDEVSDTSMVGFRAAGAPFSEFYAFVPNGTGAMPNDKCDRVYQAMEVAATDAGPDAKTGPAPPAIFHAP